MDNPSVFGGLTFILLHPTELPGAFQVIEPGLIEIQRKAKLDWDVMILPTQVAANQASLVLIYQDKRFAGFVIHRSAFLGFPNRHYLQVVAPYAEPWTHKEGVDAVKAIDEYAVAFAQSLGCHGIMETATREGWIRRLEKLNYKIEQWTMIKEV